MDIESWRPDPVIEPGCVEHVGGPDDGEWRPLLESGGRENGVYVPVYAVTVAIRPVYECLLTVRKLYVPYSEAT